MDDIIPYVIVGVVGAFIVSLASVSSFHRGQEEAMKDGFKQGYVEKVINKDDKVVYVWKKKL